jgi:hypothetical protein
MVVHDSTSLRHLVRNQENRGTATMSDEIVSATSTISASAEAVFAVLADPPGMPPLTAPAESGTHSVANG